MQPDPVEVTFCDLCNTSVALTDLEQGTAVRHMGKTVGACCLPALRGGGVPDGGGGARKEVGRPEAGRGETRFLTAAIAMLAAITAATLYIDHRIASVEHAARQDFDTVVRDLKAQADVVMRLSTDLDGVARKQDVEDLGARLARIDTSNGEGREQVRHELEMQNQALALLGQRVGDLQASRVDHKPQLDSISQALQQQAVALAELKAMPRRDALPAVDAPPPGMPEPVSGLPGNLAHQVARLQEADPAARFEAVDELLRSKNGAVLEHLLPMAKDADIFVRRLTVEGLREFRQSTVVEVLLVALADPEEIVRDTAWRSLKEVTGQKLPFEATASKEVRARAQQRWQDWWEKNKAGFVAG
jgi:hypothetical protein